MTATPQASEALQLITELEAFLRAKGDRNWIRGCHRSEAGARGRQRGRCESIYKAMSCAKGGFSDYNIYHEDFDTRLELNAPLDRLRERLWALLGS
jgi:hypothetical protein